METELSGVIVPLATPFDTAGEIDESAYRQQIRFMLKKNVHGLCVGGSTGEGYALGIDELRRLTAWALPQAAKGVAVSRALADEVVALGVPRANVEVVMNGVDAELFRPRDRAAARAELGLPAGPLALYVGNLKAEKGVHDQIAFGDSPAGHGPGAGR